MRALIVFESMFGNTGELADAVAGGLRQRGVEVSVTEAGSMTHDLVAEHDLLVLAAPTHALALSRPESRADAVARGARPEHAATGIREWIDTIDTHLPPGPRVVAVFDTRVSKMRRWPGSAAKQMARKLEREGCSVVARTSFYVNGVKGPLVDGETRRAGGWGRSLAGLLSATNPAGSAGG